MAVQNSLNLQTTGIVSADGDGVFTGRTITGTADFIDSANGSGVAGNPTLSIADNFEQTGMHGWNGSFVEKATTTVTSDGATITLSIEKSGGGDLIIAFSDGYYDYDTTPAQTVILTAGTDTVPQINYVYILQSTKALTVSTTNWPATECARIATVICPTAALTQTDGPYEHHQWTDDVKEPSEQGHITDITYWIRSQFATWHEGVVQTYTITTNAGSADNVILTTTSGEILQLHENAFPAFAGTPDIYVVNDFTTPYLKITDLNAALTDSTGVSMSGRYFSLVIWGVSNQNTGDCKLFVNLPSGSYSNATSVTNDTNRYANFTIPSEYRGTGFLISQWNLRHQTTANGTWASIDEVDLRGFLPNLSAGGTNAFPSEFVDSAFRVYDDIDNTKQAALQCSGITASTTRTLTVPDADGTITLGSGFNQYGTAVATNSTTLEVVSPSATVGVPFVSSGAAANPAYGTAVVAGGGSGRTTATAYSVLCGGTTTTAAHQSVASVGTSGQALLSNGAGVLPTFQDVPGGSGITFLASATASTSAAIEFTSLIDSTYNTYFFIIKDLLPVTDGDSLVVRTSSDSGVSFDSTAADYCSSNNRNGTSSSTTNGTFINLGALSGNDTDESNFGYMKMSNPSDTGCQTYLCGEIGGKYNATYYGSIFSGIRNEDNLVDAVQFLMQSGNITSGSISMYGMTKPS